MNCPLFSRLLLAHLMADFPLQPDELHRLKKYYWGIIFHAVVFGMTAAIILHEYIGRPSIAIAIVVLTLVHAILDAGKSNLEKNRSSKDSLWLFWLDQSLHVGSIALTAYLLKPVRIPKNGIVDSLVVAVIAVWAAPIIFELVRIHFQKAGNNNWIVLKFSGDKLGLLERAALFIAALEMGWFLLLGLVIIPRMIGWALGKKIRLEPISWATALCLGVVAGRMII